MKTSYDVRIWQIKTYKGTKSTTYRVRWKVAQSEFRRVFGTRALADSFRADMLSAARRGEVFDIGTGMPASKQRTASEVSWYDFACQYADMKWPGASPGHRRTIVDSLIPITMAMLTTQRGMPNAATTRSALRRGFNKNNRKQENEKNSGSPAQWVQRNIRPVHDLANPEVLRAVIAEAEKRLDGKQAAMDTIRLRRTTLRNALDYAVERNLMETNPMAAIKVTRRKAVLQEVDRRAVANPIQARALLDAVATTGRSGPPLVAFFGLMYYAALRPEEAATLRTHNLSLPSNGWGEIYVERATPEVGEQWTDSGTRSEERGLKHRVDGAGRIVPSCPELTELLHNHLDSYGTARDGRLFRGARDGGRVGSTVYGRVWAKARTTALTPQQSASPLAKRPYDLRHAAVSTWLNAGVEPTRVAEWAGHSVAVLLRVYAKCVHGGEEAARARVEQALQRWRT